MIHLHRHSTPARHVVLLESDTVLSMKRCVACGDDKELSSFGRDKNARDGLRSRCKTCVRADNSRYYHANKEARLAAAKAWVAENREEANRQARERNRRNHEKLKREIIAAYGGKCVCCDETDIHFLTLDHINGRPEEHKGTNRPHVYRMLKREGFPPGYRILCWNCNCSYGQYGFCPHQEHSAEERRYAA